MGTGKQMGQVDRCEQVDGNFIGKMKTGREVKRWEQM